MGVEQYDRPNGTVRDGEQEVGAGHDDEGPQGTVRMLVIGVPSLVICILIPCVHSLASKQSVVAHGGGQVGWVTNCREVCALVATPYISTTIDRAAAGP